jgi:hypothetical protein
MNVRAAGIIFVVVTALLLGGCASKQIRAQREAAKAAKAAAAAGKPVETDALLASYRRVKKGDEYLYCSTDGVTGSRTQRIETCLTAAQLKVQREKNQELMRRVQQNPGEQPSGGPPTDPTRWPGP